MKTKRVLFLAKYWKTTAMEGINTYFMDLKNNYVAQSPNPYYTGNRVRNNRKLIQATKKCTFRGQSFTLPISLKKHYLERRESFERQQIFNLAWFTWNELCTFYRYPITYRNTRSSDVQSRNRKNTAY